MKGKVGDKRERGEVEEEPEFGVKERKKKEELKIQRRDRRNNQRKI